ncbi:MAG: copper transporter family protein [Crocinitomicaceae bacterium]|nr:copper transporter family protein [Crocinitomicaceae bacterium]
MKIALDEKKNNRRKAIALLFVLAQYAAAFLIMADSYKDKNAITENIIYFIFIILGATVGFLLFDHYWKLKKQKDCIISYENGVLNDQSAWLGKIYNLKVEEVLSIARWSRSKKVNEYKIVVGPEYKGGNEIQKLFKRRSLYIKDTVVNSDELLKLAEMIGNDVAKRKHDEAQN